MSWVEWPLALHIPLHMEPLVLWGRMVSEELQQGLPFPSCSPCLEMSPHPSRESLTGFLEGNPEEGWEFMTSASPPLALSERVHTGHWPPANHYNIFFFFFRAAP